MISQSVRTYNESISESGENKAFETIAVAEGKRKAKVMKHSDMPLMFALMKIHLLNQNEG